MRQLKTLKDQVLLQRVNILITLSVPRRLDCYLKQHITKIIIKTSVNYYLLAVIKD